MSDVDWAFSDRDISKRYAGQVIAVRDRRVWGAGPDLDAALAAAQAQPGCPELRRLRIVVMPDGEVSFYPFPPIPNPMRKAPPTPLRSCLMAGF